MKVFFPGPLFLSKQEQVRGNTATRENRTGEMAIVLFVRKRKIKIPHSCLLQFFFLIYVDYFLRSSFFFSIIGHPSIHLSHHPTQILFMFLHVLVLFYGKWGMARQGIA